MAAAAVVPLLAYGAVSIISLRGGARAAVIQGNLNVARRGAEQIELYVSTSIRILQAAASELQRTGLVAWQQERILKNYALKFPEFTELTLTAENGDTIVTSRIGPSTVMVPGADSLEKNGVLMSRFALDDAALPTTVLAIPVEEMDQRHWLVARVSLEELWRMVDRIRVGQRGFALVITKEGQLIAHGEPESKSLVARREDMRSHPLFVADDDTHLKAETSDSAEYDDWATGRIGGKRPGRLLGVRAQVPALGWTVIVEQPTAEAFEVPRQLEKQLFVAITLALWVMLSVGYFFGRSFIRPILNLTRGTKALAEGHLEERVVVD